MALLGPSGSGKTTLLRLVAGLEEPTQGRILFGTEDATRMAVRERRVGFVFQHYALFRHLSVAENIAYGLRVRPRRDRPSDAEINRRVSELLELVRLSGLGQRRPSQLSGGQRQRVALARALAVDPRVLLLDEPFGALDAQVRRDLRRWLREVHDRTGHTTLFVTHDQQEALELADRVAVLHRGRLEQVGTPDEILDRPASAFVAGFIGEAVRLPATVVGRTLELGRLRLPLAEPVPPGPAALFVRPYDLVPADGPENDSFPVEVAAVRRSGSARRVEVTLGADDLPMIEMEVPHTIALRKGDVLRVRFTTLRVFTVG